MATYSDAYAPDGQYDPKKTVIGYKIVSPLSEDEKNGLAWAAYQAPRNLIMASIARLMAHRPLANPTENQARILQEDIAYELDGISHGALFRALGELKKTGRWFPSTGEIIDACVNEHKRIQQIKQAAEVADEQI